jgi:hypothetical protein
MHLDAAGLAERGDGRPQQVHLCVCACLHRNVAMQDFTVLCVL